jgi:hypothetical protein
MRAALKRGRNPLEKFGVYVIESFDYVTREVGVYYQKVSEINKA